MSEKKQTFIDPHTGEEIESTALARWICGLVCGLLGGLLGGLAFGLLGVLWGWLHLGLKFGLEFALKFGLVFGLKYGLKFGLEFGLVAGSVAGLITGLGGSKVWRPDEKENVWSIVRIGGFGGLAFGMGIGMGFGLGFGLVAGLGFGLVAGLGFGLLTGLGAKLDVKIHDSLARRQHLRRQRILQRQEFPHVPDGALSQVSPPGEPEPTPASLSRAEAPEEEAPPRQAAGVDRATEAGEQGVEAKR